MTRSGAAIPIIAVAVAVATATGPASARPPNPLMHWFAHSEDRAWLQAYDPTLISERVHSELSYRDMAEDESELRLETSLRWPIPLGDRLALGLQVMAPLEWKDTNGSEVAGISDLEFRTGLTARISPTLRCGVGLNVAFDSASEPDLGSGALVLRPIAAIRWDAADHLNLGAPLVAVHSLKNLGHRDARADRPLRNLTAVVRLDGAASEKILPSGHSAHHNPEGIAEVRRILHLHLRDAK